MGSGTYTYNLDYNNWENYYIVDPNVYACRRQGVELLDQYLLPYISPIIELINPDNIQDS